jgi:hypothetical protein
MMEQSPAPIAYLVVVMAPGSELATLGFAEPVGSAEGPEGQGSLLEVEEES